MSMLARRGVTALRVLQCSGCCGAEDVTALRTEMMLDEYDGLNELDDVDRECMRGDEHDRRTGAWGCTISE